MLNRNRKMAAVLLSVLMLTASSCSGKKIMDKDGNILEYTLSEMLKKSGYFVRIEHASNDVIFQPLLQPNDAGYMSFRGQIKDMKDQKSRFIMLADRDNLIPVITGSNLLVYVDDSTAIPETFELEKFADGGWTFGSTFISSENQKGLRIDTSYNRSFVTNSDMNRTWKDKKNLNLYSLDMIGETAIGETNLDRNGVFQGLEKGKTYEIQCYVGTKYEKVSVEADTHYFVSETVIHMSQADCISKTKNGFVIISLPSTLTTGYYLINGQYFFYFDAENTSKIAVTERFSYMELETKPTSSGSDSSETYVNWDEIAEVTEDLDDCEDP